MNTYIEILKVKTGGHVNLKKANPDFHGEFKNHKKAAPSRDKYLDKMNSLQYLLYAENDRSLLIVLQGLDAAGKDGVIRHVLTSMNPQGCTVSSFKQPTTEELNHDFLWRIHPHSPKKGAVAIFNRSHYEDVLVTRVHKLVSAKECLKRYDRINDYEKLLVTENKTLVLKFFLHISKDEQLDRFAKRLKDPSHNWKISDGDYKERNFWDSYTTAYEELFKHTSSSHAPWFIIPSNHKWFRNLAIAQIITKSLENLKMQLPKASVDLNEIRLKYHKAVANEKSVSQKLESK